MGHIPAYKVSLPASELSLSICKNPKVLHGPNKSQPQMQTRQFTARSIGLETAFQEE